MQRLFWKMNFQLLVERMKNVARPVKESRIEVGYELNVPYDYESEFLEL